MDGMEVRLSPEVQAKLEEFARESGRSTDEVVSDALTAYVDEVSQLRQMLETRYDDLASGRVKPIDGEEAYRRLTEKTEARRRRPA